MLMKLFKPVYEGLPYFYFLTSGCLLASGDSVAVMLSAILFYGAGCVTLVTRSYHRRLDKPSESKQYFIPDQIYEYIPYVTVAVAIFLFLNTTNAYIQLIAFAMGVLAVRILLFRHNNRCKAKALF